MGGSDEKVIFQEHLKGHALSLRKSISSRGNREGRKWQCQEWSRKPDNEEVLWLEFLGHHWVPESRLLSELCNTAIPSSSMDLVCESARFSGNTPPSFWTRGLSCNLELHEKHKTEGRGKEVRVTGESGFHSFIHSSIHPFLHSWSMACSICLLVSDTCVTRRQD